MIGWDYCVLAKSTKFEAWQDEFARSHDHVILIPSCLARYAQHKKSENTTLDSRTIFWYFIYQMTDQENKQLINSQ